MTRMMYGVLTAGVLLSTLALPAAIASADPTEASTDTVTAPVEIAGADNSSAPQSGNYWELIKP